MRDLEDLLEMGRELEARPALITTYVEGLLRVRDREGRERPLKANAVQMVFERERGRQKAERERGIARDIDIGTARDIPARKPIVLKKPSRP